MTEFTLSDLERIVAERASVTDGSSYTASLVAKGQARAAKSLVKKLWKRLLPQWKATVRKWSPKALICFIICWWFSRLRTCHSMRFLQSCNAARRRPALKKKPVVRKPKCK